MTSLDPADGLPVNVVGTWCEDKYLHVEHYAHMFAKSMKGKWDRLTYLELFAGAGRVRIRDTDRAVDAAALRALGIAPTFDLYVYGELDKGLLSALEQRCQARSPESRCSFVQGDVNKRWPVLRDRIRQAAEGGSYLTFCFVDPYNCQDLAFSTLEGLAELYLDFLVLIPSHMDANRNQARYLRDSTTVLDRYLGSSCWRTAWNSAPNPKPRFGDFVAHQFGLRMQELGFLYDGLQDMTLVRSTDRNLRLYHLAFFSRNALGQKLWREAVKSSNPQRRLF